MSGEPFAALDVRYYSPLCLAIGAGFSVADIVMAKVLRGLQDEFVLSRHPVVAAYLERCLARPDFQATLSAQLATFAENEPA